MHDISRGANSTAARLAALTALREAQAEEALRHPNGVEAPANPPRAAGIDAPDTTHRLGRDVSTGVFAAVEAAVQRSRLEFIDRLVEYRTALDCQAMKRAASGQLDGALDQAQFVAHRIAGVGKTLGFTELGDQARQTEAAITAYKVERTPALRETAVGRVCRLVGQIESVCAEHDCPV